MLRMFGDQNPSPGIHRLLITAEKGSDIREIFFVRQ